MKYKNGWRLTGHSMISLKGWMQKSMRVWCLLALFMLLGYMAVSIQAGEKGRISASNEINKERLITIGRIVVFGTEEDPKVFFARGENPSGKGQCPLCHQASRSMHELDRGPSFINLEVRSHERIKEGRYKEFMERYANGEPRTGINPHAKTGGEYIIESMYCPSCYIAKSPDFMWKDNSDSLMPAMSFPPVDLTDEEIIAVTAYIQSMDTPGNYSKVTAKEDWERYFGKKITLTEESFKHLRQ
jgi:hypothetical protein